MVNKKSTFSLFFKIVIILILCGALVFVLYTTCIVDFIPKNTVVKVYDFNEWKIEIVRNKYKGNFPSLNVYAKNLTKLFSSNILLYYSEERSDSLQIEKVGNTVFINPFIGDSLVNERSCEYDLINDKEPCRFTFGGTYIKH